MRPLSPFLIEELGIVLDGRHRQMFFGSSETTSPSQHLLNDELAYGICCVDEGTYRKQRLSKAFRKLHFSLVSAPKTNLQ